MHNYNHLTVMLHDECKVPHTVVKTAHAQKECASKVSIHTHTERCECQF